MAELRARIGKVLKTERVQRRGAEILDVLIDAFGGPARTSEQASPAGFDSRPLESDWGVDLPREGAGRRVVLGYVDPENPGATEPGETRMTGRNADAEILGWIRCYRDGSIRLSSAGGGSIEMQTDGTVVINGVKIGVDGSVTDGGGIVLGTHVHGGVESGSADTGEPK